MAEYTRKDIICFTDDPRLENAIGKKVFGENSLTNLLFLANECNPDLYCETLAFIKKNADSCPFSTYMDGNWGYKHYDAIIIKKEES